MDRRHYLGGLATILTGCAGQRGSTPATSKGPTETSSPTTAARTTPAPTPPEARTAVPPDETDLASNTLYRTGEGWIAGVAIFRARRAIVAGTATDGEPVFPPSKQFLQLGVDTYGAAAPAPDSLCLAAAVDGDRPFEGCPAHVDPGGEPFGTLQAVPVPLEFDGESAAVVWDRQDAPAVRWRVGSRTLDALRHPPNFVVKDLVVPEAVAENDRFEVGIDVQNTGERKDWFVAELGLQSETDGMNVELPFRAGERNTPTRELTADFGGSDELTVRLDWGLDAIETQVEKA